jgi:hypothetical protein
MAQCWICESDEAEDLTSGGYDGKQLRCLNCGRYDVTGSVIFKLAALLPVEKVELLSKAKRMTEIGAVPTVSTLSF